MKAFWLTVLAAFIVVSTWSVGASASQADRDVPLYRLQISLFDGDRLVGQPNVTVSHGQPAIVTVEKAGGYSLRVVTARDEAQPESGRIKVATEVFFREGSGWRQVAAPRMTLVIGTKGTVEAQSRGTPSRPFRMEVLAIDAPAAAASLRSTACSKATQSAWRKAMTESAELRY